MATVKDYERLKQEVERKIRLMGRAEKDHPSMFTSTIYLGTLGLLMVIPIVLGAYLGVWLDRRFGTFFWTIGLLVLGVVIGAVNTYLYLRE